MAPVRKTATITCMEAGLYIATDGYNHNHFTFRFHKLKMKPIKNNVGLNLYYIEKKYVDQLYPSAEIYNPFR